MSGGSWDYIYQSFEEVAQKLHNENDFKRKALGVIIQYIAKALYDIEWVDSGDYGFGMDEESIDIVLNFNSKQIMADLATKELENAIKQANTVLNLLYDEVKK